MFYEPRNGHGLPRDPFKALVTPRPIGWFTTLNDDGTVNIAPYSYFNAVADDPPFIMFSSGAREDVPVKDSARNAALTNNFFSTGQVCSNGTRVFVQRGVYEAFLDGVAERVASLRVGDPFNPDTIIGPLVSREHHAKVMGYMDLARASGARHIVGGDVPDDPALAAGNYVTPAVFADCADDMGFVTDEVFGPLMAVLPFDDEAEVVARANATPYGLSGAVFSRDLARANRVANAIEAGSVWINDYGTLPESVPFGGYKRSGIGRENGYHSIEHYTQVKMIYTNLGEVDRYM